MTTASYAGGQRSGRRVVHPPAATAISPWPIGASTCAGSSSRRATSPSSCGCASCTAASSAPRSRRSLPEDGSLQRHCAWSGRNRLSLQEPPRRRVFELAPIPVRGSGMLPGARGRHREHRVLEQHDRDARSASGVTVQLADGSPREHRAEHADAGRLQQGDPPHQPGVRRGDVQGYEGSLAPIHRQRRRRHRPRGWNAVRRGATRRSHPRDRGRGQGDGRARRSGRCAGACYSISA